MYKFTIPGEPTGKARPRVTKWGTHTPEKTVLYENLVKTCYDGPMMEGPLMIEVIAYYQIAKSASAKQKQAMMEMRIYPTKKPDADNILKIAADALNGIAYKDDSQIVIARIEKRYSDNPRVEVKLEELK